MKKILVMLVAFAMAFSLFAVTASADDVKTLDIIWWTDGAETISMQSLIDEYEAAHPDIKINLIDIAFSDLNQKLAMAIAGGEAPALTRATETTISQFHESMVDFADYADAAALKAFYPDAVGYLMYSGDQIAAIPMEVTANGMIINKTAFDQAGVSYPTKADEIWTWDEFKEALKTVVANSDVEFGMAIDNPSHRWMTMLYEFGGSLTKDGQGNMSSEESQNAIKFTKSLFDEDLAVSSVWLSGEDPNNLFRSGKLAVHISGTWMLQNYSENIKDFEWAVTYMPIGTTRSSVPGGKSISVLKGTGLEKEAAEFALWVTDKEQNAKYCLDSLFVSPRTDNATLDYPICKDAFAIFADELANTVPAAGIDFGYPGYSGQMYSELTNLWQDVLVGNITPEDMGAEFDELTNEILAELS